MRDTRKENAMPARPWQDESTRETDARFPSCFWTGFWQQLTLRGKMELGLNFADRMLFGEGRDLVGDFTISGSYDIHTGLCTMLKTYLGHHQVEYDGHVATDGIRGLWRITYPDKTIDTGRFHIWPLGPQTGDRLAARSSVSNSLMTQSKP